MKNLFLTLILLISISSTYSQRYFSADYQVSSNDSTADGILMVEFHNHSNLVSYSIVLTNNMLMFDTIIAMDSISNILIVDDPSMNNVANDYDSYEAYAIDMMNGDTLGYIQGPGTSTVGNLSNIIIDFDSVMPSQTNISCDGSFALDTAIMPTPYSGNFSPEELFYSPQYSDITNMTLMNMSTYKYDTVNLCAGYYVFRSSIGTASFFIDTDSIVNIPTPLTAADVTVNVTTINSCNSSAVVNINPNHNSAPYSYSWNNGSFIIDSTYNSLCLGGNKVVIANSQGDTITKLFDVQSTATNLNSGDLQLFINYIAGCNSDVQVEIYHNSGPYTYSWNYGTYTTDSLMYMLCAGQNNVRVSNSIGDTVLKAFYLGQTIDPFTNSSAGVVQQVRINCQSSAEAIIHYPNNSGPFKYSWNNGAFTSDNTIDSLCFGNNIVRIANSYGDTITYYLTSINNESLLSNYVLTGCDGEAEANFNTNVANPFSWDGGAYVSNKYVNNFCFGVHTLSHVDLVGDTIQETFNISQVVIDIFSNPDTLNCMGTAFFPSIYSNSSIDFSLNGSAFKSIDHLFFYDSMCSGIHSLVLTKNQDTVFLTFGITNGSNNYTSTSLNTGNPYNDSISLYYENCVIDYTLPIDSTTLSHSFIDSIHLGFDLNIWQSGLATSIIDTVLLSNQLNGISKFSVTLYCYVKSNDKVIKISRLLDTQNAGSVGIEFTKKNETKVYPNPFTNTLFIDLENLVSVQVLNLQGKVIYTSKNTSLDLSFLSKGIYLLKVSNGYKQEVIKIVKK